MDIVQFAEEIVRVELPEWQKEYLRTLYDFQRKNPNKRIYINVRPFQGRDVFYTYFKEYASKELSQDGTSLNSH